jgi:hypothetical protein
MALTKIRVLRAERVAKGSLILRATEQLEQRSEFPEKRRVA